jgi:uncharacterized membrane protein (UPF0136 family)
MSDDQIQSERPEPSPIAKQPYRSGERPSLNDDNRELPKLGSLAQSARNKHLKQAGKTLLIVGILMAIVQVGMFFIDRGQVQQAGNQVDQEIAQLFLIAFHGSAILLALAFVVLSFFVERYPVPITVTALGLFLGLQVIFAVINPLNIVSGILVKIIVIVALVKALQAGIAAQREAREAEAAAEYGA